MANNTYRNTSYSLGQGPLSLDAPNPIVAKRVPTTADIGYPIGQLWVYKAGDSVYALTSVASNSATWTLLSNSGGAGVFTSLTVTPGPISLTGTTTINTTGSATTTIGTGGTGAVNIGNATGNTSVTGSLTSSTTLTATLGAITATNGNLVLGTAGNKLSIATGSNASIGTSGALNTGTVTVSTSAVTAASKIFLTRAVAGGTLGNLSVGTISAGINFTITCDSNTDTSTVNYLIIN